MAVDVKVGKKVWQTHAFAERPQPLNKKNTAGMQLYGPAGAGIWNTPTLDVKRRAIYAGTGNCNTTEHFGRDFEEATGRACDAVIAIDMDTGKKLWSTQLLAMDRDEGGCGRGPERRLNCPGYIQGPGDDVNQTMLVNLPNGRRAIIASQESGRITALDPDNKGMILWVAQAGDTMTSGSVWGGASDGQVFYRPLPMRDGTGAVAAMAPATGERIWYTTLTQEANCAASKEGCNPTNRAGAIVIPGVLFTGSRDGVVRAFSTTDGKILWEYAINNRDFDTVNGVPGKGGPIGGPGPTVVDGMLYAAAGYAILGGGQGNVLLAFGIE
jgi:polyvinyl alcohol dehydrogenase (cytochrome)